MKGERALAPLILTGIVVAISHQWPQALWGWLYSHVHYNNVTFVDNSQTSGHATNMSPNAAPPPYGKVWNPVLKQWLNMPAPGTYSTP